MAFTSQSKEDALAQYAHLFSSPDPNDKLLALGGLIQFTSSADVSFLRQCAETTDYVFLDKMIRNELKVHEEIQEDRSHFPQLACAVLGVFAKIPEMQRRDKILERIPAMICSLEEQSDAERADVLDTIQSLATIEKGANLILKPESAHTLFKIFQAVSSNTPTISQIYG